MLNNVDEETIMIWICMLHKPRLETFAILLNRFRSTKAIWDASLVGEDVPEFKDSESFQKRWTNDQIKYDAIKLREQTLSLGMKITSPLKENYPYLLREIPSRPLVLYYYGTLPYDYDARMRLSAIVGSRACTSYGLSATRKISEALSNNGVGIVSGMARGIDAMAERTAMKNGKYVVSVLASSAEKIYPEENKDIYEYSKEHGLVLSEMPPGTSPDKRYFAARNRIIAGMTESTIIVEAPRSSGAMITVDRALSYSRNVYAVPGSIFSDVSKGTNALIANGAICAYSTDYILENMGIISKEIGSGSPGWTHGLSEDETKIAKAILQGYSTPDSISNACKMAISNVTSVLTMLEIRGVIKQDKCDEYRVCI